MFFALLMATSGIFLPVDARPQEQIPPKSAAKPAPKKKHRLRITKGYITALSLKADKTRMSEIATDLSKRLGPQVILGPSLKKKRITVEFYDLPLEPALGFLAPRVYIDYEIRANAQPKPLAIFLMDYDDPDPARNAVVQGSSEAMMIEGNTEDTGEQSEAQPVDDPLQVDLEDNYLTIKSKKQLLQVAAAQSENRIKALMNVAAAGKEADLATGSPCLFCLNTLGKTPWSSLSQTSSPTSNDRTLPVLR